MESSLADLPVVYPPSSIVSDISFMVLKLSYFFLQDTFHQESLCQDISQFIESEGGNMKVSRTMLLVKYTMLLDAGRLC